jgi:hypothetical protein
VSKFISHTIYFFVCIFQCMAILLATGDLHASVLQCDVRAHHTCYMVEYDCMLCACLIESGVVHSSRLFAQYFHEMLPVQPTFVQHIFNGINAF